MLDKLKEFFIYGSKTGWNLGAAYDNDKPGPSVSLLFAHVSFYVAITAIIYLIIKDQNLGTLAAMIFAALYFIFYMLRRLTKAKIDLDDRSLDLEGEETKENK